MLINKIQIDKKFHLQFPDKKMLGTHYGLLSPVWLLHYQLHFLHVTMLQCHPASSKLAQICLMLYCFALFHHVQFCSKPAHSIIDASCLFSFHYVGGGGFSFSGGGTNLLQNQWERHKRLISSIGTPFVSGRKK